MVRSLCMLAGALVLGVSFAEAAPVVDVLPVTGRDRDYMNMPIMFDAQPTWDGSQPVSASPDETTGMWVDVDRRAAIDFGANWADLRITQVWTRYRNWSQGNVVTFQDYAWSNTFDGWNYEPLIPENQIKLSNQTALPYSNGAQWARDVDLTASPVTPQGRYLIVHAPATGLNTNFRAAEFAFIGYDATAVPEPTTVGVLAVGSLLMMKRRRA